MVRQKPLLKGRARAACSAPEYGVHLAGDRAAVVFVDHLHGDTVLVVVNGRHRMQLIVDRQVLHGRKIEVHGLKKEVKVLLFII